MPIAPVGDVSFRAFRGAEDFAPMIAVRAGNLARDGLDAFSPRDPVPTLAELAHDFAATPPGDPSLLLAEHAGTVVGWARTGHPDNWQSPF